MQKRFAGMVLALFFVGGLFAQDKSSPVVWKHKVVEVSGTNRTDESGAECCSEAGKYEQFSVSGKIVPPLPDWVAAGGQNRYSLAMSATPRQRDMGGVRFTEYNPLYPMVSGPKLVIMCGHHTDVREARFGQPYLYQAYLTLGLFMGYQGSNSLTIGEVQERVDKYGLVRFEHYRAAYALASHGYTISLDVTNVMEYFFTAGGVYPRSSILPNAQKYLALHPHLEFAIPEDSSAVIASCGNDVVNR